MSTAKKEGNVERIELQIEKGEEKLTINELLKKRKIEKKGVLFLIYNEEAIRNLNYYYNQNGIVEFYKLICDIPINNLKEYGYEIKNTITIELYNGGLGSSGGFDFISLYFIK